MCTSYERDFSIDCSVLLGQCLVAGPPNAGLATRAFNDVMSAHPVRSYTIRTSSFLRSRLTYFRSQPYSGTEVSAVFDRARTGDV